MHPRLSSSPSPPHLLAPGPRTSLYPHRLPSDCRHCSQTVHTAHRPTGSTHERPELRTSLARPPLTFCLDGDLVEPHSLLLPSSFRSPMPPPPLIINGTSSILHGLCLAAYPRPRPPNACVLAPHRALPPNRHLCLRMGPLSPKCHLVLSDPHRSISRHAHGSTPAPCAQLHKSLAIRLFRGTFLCSPPL